VALGVVVTVDIRLDGMIGKPVFVSWSMWQRGGLATLYGSWLNDHLAFRVDATTNSEVARLDFRIPPPKDPGPYFIRSRAKVAAATMASIDSENFD